MAHNINNFKRSKSERPYGVGFGQKRTGYNFQLHHVAIHLIHLTVYASTYTQGMYALLPWTFLLLT